MIRIIGTIGLIRIIEIIIISPVNVKCSCIIRFYDVLRIWLNNENYDMGVVNKHNVRNVGVSAGNILIANWFLLAVYWSLLFHLDNLFTEDVWSHHPGPYRTVILHLHVLTRALPLLVTQEDWHPDQWITQWILGILCNCFLWVEMKNYCQFSFSDEIKPPRKPRVLWLQNLQEPTRKAFNLWSVLSSNYLVLKQFAFKSIWTHISTKQQLETINHPAVRWTKGDR